MLHGTVCGQDLTVETPVVAADTLYYLTAQFDFRTPDWDGLVKVAHFSNGTESAEIELTNGMILPSDGLNLTAGTWSIALTGHKTEGGETVQRITTVRAKLRVLPSAVENGEPLPSLPSEGEEILAEVEDIRETLAGFTAEATTLAPGSSATASYDTETGVFSFGIPRGAKGEKGDPGDPGSPGSPGAPGRDGTSPTASVTKSGKTATISITDANGTTTASVSDGEDGDPGEDGFSPVATVSKSGSTATITITDANGTTTATVRDGEDGDPGQDGVTPSFSIGTVTTGAAGSDASATITGTDAEPVLNLTIPRGDPGEVTEAELTEALLDKADVIVDSASGAVASFPDGAAAPVVGLTVGVEPVQEGIGDPSPTNVRTIIGFTGATVYHSGADTSNPDEISISFPSEAGTVYGGSLDAVTGVLTVDRAMVDLGTLNWSYASNFDCYFEYLTSAHSGVPDAKEKFDAICSQYPFVGSYTNLTDKSCSFIYNQAIAVRDSNYSDTASFKSAMSGVQLVYELAEPITYQLTPTEVSTLLGTNNVWADTGDTAVEYRADTKKYIDKKLAALVAQIVNS